MAIKPLRTVPKAHFKFHGVLLTQIPTNVQLPRENKLPIADFTPHLGHLEGSDLFIFHWGFPNKCFILSNVDVFASLPRCDE
jgi:hypothetical protein